MSSIDGGMEDIVNAKGSTRGLDEKHPGRESDNRSLPSPSQLSLSRRLLTWGVELRGLSQISNSRRSSAYLLVHTSGIHPVAIEDRKETQFNKIFFIWLSANTNILSCVVPFFCTHLPWWLTSFRFCLRFSSGTLGPVAFGLGLRDSCLVILFFNLLVSIPPAYL